LGICASAARLEDLADAAVVQLRRYYPHESGLVRTVLVVEVTQGLRRLARFNEVTPARAAEAIADLADFDLHRHALLDLLPRAWQLRGNVTAYDAMYIALAEALDATVVTCDVSLAKAPGHRARIEAVE